MELDMNWKLIIVAIAYVCFCFLPCLAVPKGSRYRGTVAACCFLAVPMPIMWLVAIVFASLPADKPSPPPTRQFPDATTRH